MVQRNRMTVISRCYCVGASPVALVDLGKLVATVVLVVALVYKSREWGGIAGPGLLSRVCLNTSHHLN